MTRSVFRPKQSLGQNFLQDENIARKIVSVIDPRAEDSLIEIGPGYGVLTKYLVQAAGHVTAVEIDGNLSGWLARRMAQVSNLTLIHADFLKVELAELVRQGPAKIVGNIPYQITSPVLFKLFANRNFVSQTVLMVQKEVAQRIVARPGTKAYGIMSVFSRLYSEPRIEFHVSRNVFKPRPEVESSVVVWDFSKARKFLIHSAELLTEVVRTTFNQRRKMLRNSLQRLSCYQENLPSLDFDLTRRPEQLDVEEFVALSNQIDNLWKKKISQI